MFVCLGLSHRTAPAHVRERHTFHESTLSEVLIALLDYDQVREAAILSTCNRLEIYADLADFDAGVGQLKQFLINFRHGEVGYDIDPYLYVLRGDEGVEHLLRVTTGLDSMLIGETEILGQVKAAYHRAQDARSCGPLLHHIFREVLSAGKRARARTSITTASASIATAAVAIAKRELGSLRGRSVLLIGAGNMALKAAQRVKLEGPSKLIVTSRTLARARGLVARLGMGEAVEIEQLSSVIRDVDVVISSTAASKFLLTPATILTAMQGRSERTLCLLDIAIPRNVDPDVAHVPGVRLIDIDGVGSMMGPAIEACNPAIKSVEAIVEAGVRDFERWCRSRRVSPMLARIAKRAEAIREQELQRVLARSPQRSERERRLLIGMSMRIVSRLMHPAFSKLTDLLDEGDLSQEVVEALFDLDPSVEVVTAVAPASEPKMVEPGRAAQPA